MEKLILNNRTKGGVIMVLVFIMLEILICVAVLFLILLLSTIKVKIENLQVGKQMEEKRYRVIIELYFINRLKILKIKFNSSRLRKLYSNKKLQEIDLKKIEKALPLNKITLKILSKIKIEKLNLQVALSTGDAVLTSYAVGTIAGTVGAILPHFVIDNNPKKYFYKIQPVYLDENIFNMYLDSIISIKVVHIIYIIYKFGIKKV